jgi:hypothetical protein
MGKDWNNACLYLTQTEISGQRQENTKSKSKKAKTPGEPPRQKGKKIKIAIHKIEYRRHFRDVFGSRIYCVLVFLAVTGWNAQREME